MIFVTGATGFTGSRTVPILVQAGYQVRCLYRAGSDRSPLEGLDIDWIEGDLNDSQSILTAMQGCHTLVNIASLGFGHAEMIVENALAAGLKRAVFISTTAIFTQLNAASKTVRLAAEETIQRSQLDYTILRPTMIYGSPRDRNIWRLIKLIRSIPVIPIFGKGTYLQQPIFVDDVVSAILLVLQNDLTIRNCYNIAGLEEVSYNQMIDCIAAQLQKKIIKVHLPATFAMYILSTLERIGIHVPIKAEQIQRLNENKNFEIQTAKAAFNFQPRSFESGIALELQYLDKFK